MKAVEHLSWSAVRIYSKLGKTISFILAFRQELTHFIDNSGSNSNVIALRHMKFQLGGLQFS